MLTLSLFNHRGFSNTVVLDVLCSGSCVRLFSPPVSAPEVPLQPPNSRHLPLGEPRPPRHSDAPTADEQSLAPGESYTAPQSLASGDAETCQYEDTKVAKPQL